MVTPEDWRGGFPAGTFAQASLPEVPGAELVEGLFEDTLPRYLADHDEPVALLHIDSYLYSSAKTVLELVGPGLWKARESCSMSISIIRGGRRRVPGVEGIRG
jgi:hypothetical protein